MEQAVAAEYVDKNNYAGQFVVFSINGQLCSLPIEEVIEIIRIQTITEVPGVKEYLTGMINLRGNIIPVVNLRKRYNMAVKDYDKKNRIIIVEDEGENIGLIVDEVKMVTYVDQDHVEPTLDMFNRLEKDNFKGFAKKDDLLIGILNIQKVLYPTGNEKVIKND